MPATPSAPAPPPPATCPSCHTPITGSPKFCPSCGASLVAPPAPPPPPPAPGAPSAGAFAPPPPGAPPVDLRTRVDQDRGFLKRLQLLVPGFRAYRTGEDLRAADSLLRVQVADKVHQALSALEDARSSLSNSGKFASLSDLAGIISDLNQLEPTIRNAQQGYTGISPATRIRPESQEELYQYDYGFALAADQIGTSAVAIRGQAGTSPSLADPVNVLRDQVRQLKASFQARINVVEHIQVQ